MAVGGSLGLLGSVMYNSLAQKQRTSEKGREFDEEFEFIKMDPVLRDHLRVLSDFATFKPETFREILKTCNKLVATLMHSKGSDASTNFLCVVSKNMYRLAARVRVLALELKKAVMNTSINNTKDFETIEKELSQHLKNICSNASSDAQYRIRYGDQ